MARRDQLIKQFVKRNPAPPGSPFGRIGNRSAGQRIKGAGGRITEDDPRWNPKTMGNKRYRDKGFIRQG